MACTCTDCPGRLQPIVLRIDHAAVLAALVRLKKGKG